MIHAGIFLNFQPKASSDENMINTLSLETNEQRGMELRPSLSLSSAIFSPQLATYSYLARFFFSFFSFLHSPGNSTFHKAVLLENEGEVCTFGRLERVVECPHVGNWCSLGIVRRNRRGGFKGGKF